MAKRVTIRILPDGMVQAEVQGVKGKKCTDYIRILEELLEAEAVDSAYTDEYHQTEELTVTHQQEQTIDEQQVLKQGN